MGLELVAVGMVAVGFQLAFQAPVNGILSERTGPLGAAFLNFLTGFGLFVVLVALSGDLHRLAGLDEVSPLELAGGVCGAAYVLAATWAVGRIGAGAIVAATVAGQLTSATSLDHLGAFGLEADPAGLTRLLAVPLLVAGALLVAGDRSGGGWPLVGRVSLLPVLVVFGVGLAVGLQHPLNASLSEAVGDLGAAGLNFTVGAVFLGLALVATGGAKYLPTATGAPPWAFIGGLIGSITVLASLVAVDTLGAAGLAATTIAGALVGAVVIDRLGLLGVTRRPLDLVRLFGLVLLAGGTAAVV